MGRRAVVCMVCMATFGIAGTVNAGNAAAAPVKTRAPKPVPVSVSVSAQASATVRKAVAVREPAGVRKHTGVRKPAGAVRMTARTKVVRYDGYTFSVPAAWPVYRLGPGSTRCVRYDTSAVYLGTPGKNQQCPAQLVGQADTVSIDASSASPQRGRPVIELQSAEVGAQATSQASARPGLTVTATYGANPGTVRRILHSVRSAHSGAAVAIHQSAVAAPPPPVSPSRLSAVPAASSPPVKTHARRARAHARAQVQAPRRTVLASPWERDVARLAPRWYRALWYMRAWAYYLGEQGWPAAPVPGVPPQASRESAPVTPAPASPALASPTPASPALATSAPASSAPKLAVRSTPKAAITPPYTPKPSVTPRPSAAPKPSATPKPPVAPRPAKSATPKPPATPEPPATPRPAKSAAPKPPATPGPAKSAKPGHGRVSTTPLRAPSRPLPGFDTCTAPSLQTMRAWRHTYSVAAIYIGGVEMACDYGNLSASWVKSVTAMGWSLIPLYVGLQAPCNGFSKEIQSNSAASEGTGAANSAVLDARSFGLGRGTPIYFDMEAYNSGNSGCRDSVLSFLNHWTRELHSRGYVSGVYSSAASGAEDLGNATSVYGHQVAKPDSMWFALWDDKANLVGTPYLLNSWWNPDRRIKQYKGTHWVKVGGVNLSIDSDWVQGPVY